RQKRPIGRCSTPLRSRRLARIPHLWVSVLLLCLYAPTQAPLPSASLHGMIRDSEDHPIAQALVALQNTDSRDNFQTQTDAQESYTFAKVPNGLYHLDAMKEGYADAGIASLFLKPGDTKAIDLTITVQQAGHPAPSSTPQFSDKPQFTVAGVTD